MPANGDEALVAIEPIPKEVEGILKLATNPKTNHN
jgi:hypothetical protein